ncbi:hypothetical protein [Lacinutrix sp. MEBiC02595]
MRHINFSGYKPKNWQAKADKKLLELRSRSSADRKIFIDASGNRIWSEHRLPLQRLSKNKCWFSEADPSVSDLEIEHFRPKKSISPLNNKDNYPEKRVIVDREGYWWLSYNLENFRLAGRKPNQLKRTYFPLETSSIIANNNDESWRLENNMLLDPCVKDDIKLLTYDGTTPTEAIPNTSSTDHIRARISIKVYGLTHSNLKRARSRVYEEAKNYFESAKQNWIALNINKGVNQDAYDLALENFNTQCTNLVSLLHPKRTFTKMLYAFLDDLSLAWVDDYVLDIADSKGYLKSLL